MFVSQKTINKKTHLMTLGFNQHLNQQFSLTKCGSGASGRATFKQASNYSLREINSINEIANENLCSKCFGNEAK